MTASITHSCRSVLDRAAAAVRFLLAAAVLTLAAAAHAGSIEPTEAALVPGDDATYRLRADFRIELGARLEEVVSRGVPLYFNLEFDLTRPRWYWFNEHIATVSLVHRLSYNALTRQYRLSSGPLQQNFASLHEALRVLGRIVALPVADKAAIKSGESYQATVRLSLDRNQLPKPLQLDTIADRDWQVDAKVLRWQFVPPERTAGSESR